MNETQITFEGMLNIYMVSVSVYGVQTDSI